MADRSNIAVGAAMACAALMPLNSTMIAVAIPDIAHDLGGSAASATQILVGAYLVTAIVLQSPGGKIGDRIGHWRLLQFGQLAVMAGAVVGWLGPSIGVLGVARLLTAVGGAALVPATVALMRIELPPARRASAFGHFGAVMALAAAAGPLVGGELAALFGWRSLFLVNFPLVIVSAAIIFACRRGEHRKVSTKHPRFDWLGSVLLGATLTCAIVGLRSTGFVTAGLVCAAIALAAVFWLAERRAADPVIDFSLFRRSGFSAGTAIIALQNLAMYALVFQMPIVFHIVLGLEPNSSGRVLVTMMIAMVALSLLSGRISARVGIRNLVIAGSASAALGTALLWLVEPDTSLVVIAVALALCGAGIGACAPAAQSAAQSSAPAEQAGMAAGVTSTLRYIGGVVGIAVLGLLLDDRAPAPTVVTEHRELLGIYVAAIVVSAFAALALPAKEPIPATATV